MPLAIAKLVTTNQHLYLPLFSDVEFVVNALDDPDSTSPLCVHLNYVLNIHDLNIFTSWCKDILHLYILVKKKKFLPVKTLTTAQGCMNDMQRDMCLY